MELPVLVAVALLGAVGGAVLGMLARTLLVVSVDEGRAVGGPPDRGRGPRPPEGADPRGEGREAAHPARGGGRGTSPPQRAVGPRAAAPPARRAARPAHRHARAARPKLLEREREHRRAREEAREGPPGAGRRPRAGERLSAEDAKGLLLEAVREEAEHDAVKLGRAIERKARDEADEKARDIIVTAIQRFAADQTAEHTVTVVHLPNDEMKGRIIGREGRNIRALEQATGVDLIIDDTPGGGRPRRASTRFAARSPASP